jgi:hypothetical protein
MMINCQKVSILNTKNRIPETFRNPYLETLDKNMKIPKDLTLPTDRNISSMKNKDLHSKLPTEHKNLSNSKAITLPRSDKHNLMKNMDLSLPTSETDQTILETNKLTIPLGEDDEKLIYPNLNSLDPKVLETKGKEILKTQMIEHSTSPVQQTQIQSPNFHYPSDLKSELEDSHSDLLTPLLKSAQQKK